MAPRHGPRPVRRLVTAVVACVALALGLLAADGIFIVIGIVAAAGSLVLASGVVYGGLVAAIAFLKHLLA